MTIQDRWLRTEQQTVYVSVSSVHTEKNVHTKKVKALSETGSDRARSDLVGLDHINSHSFKFTFLQILWPTLSGDL